MTNELHGIGLTFDFMEIFPFPIVDNLVFALAVSFAVCLLNIATRRWHGRYSADSDIQGIQKVHKEMVPRTGGIGLAAGMVAVAAYGAGDAKTTMVRLLIAAIPAFLSGIVEDLTKAVAPKTRMYLILLSACLAAWLLAPLPRLDVWGLDGLLQVVPISVAITAIAVAGVTNSINIIDGFHGVAGLAVVIVLSGMGFLAWRAGDALIVQLAAAGIGTTIGFLMLNYPTGRLFMGDGGAYFLGFWIAQIAVLTVVRNPQINTWQILAIYSYPVVEVLFSIYRRMILKGARPGAPDRLHLHSLFYRRFARHRIGGKKYPWMCNAGVACFISTWIGIATCLSVLFGDTVLGGFTLVLIQAVLYIAVYMRLVRGHWGHCRHPAVVFGLRPQPRHHSLDSGVLVANPRPLG